MKQFFSITFFLLALNCQAESILVFGDSHSVGSFGGTLYKALDHDHPGNVVSEACWGAGPHTFDLGRPCPLYLHRGKDGIVREEPSAAVPTTKSLLEKYKPTTVIVALGSNNWRVDPDRVRPMTE